jgi:hypothetical protein
MVTGLRPNPASLDWYSADLETEGYFTAMEFRLVYDGPLKATTTNQSRVKDKHAIRRQLHKQLSTLYDNHPTLRSMRYYVYPEGERITMSMRQAGVFMPDSGASITETMARRFARANGFRFVPLVNKQYDLICSLDVLFLRRENPGDLLLQGGDIDNRVKTLFDALRIPEGTELPAEAVPGDGEDPMYCLLENDSLVTDLKVTTDRLLRPLRNEQESETDVMLIMSVNVKASQVNGINLALM